MKYKLVAFDVDGTLTEEKSGWRFIHKHLGVTSEAERNSEKYGHVEDITKWMWADYCLWNNITRDELKKAFSNIKFRPGARELVKHLHNNGYEVVLITHTVDVFADLVAEKLGIKHVKVARFEYDKAGKAVGVDGVYYKDKGVGLRELAKSLNIPLEETAAVGDGTFDKGMFDIAGLAIGTNCKESTKEHVDYVADDLLDIKQILS